MVFSRRSLLALALAAAGMTQARAVEAVRLGVLQYGTVQWLADVIARHRFDQTQGFTLQPVPLANSGAGRIALLAGDVDVIVSDWLFAAVQRDNGTPMRFVPLSTSSGGVVVRDDSAIHRLADLPGCRLGVAGGPFDKSWLIVQAALRHTGLGDISHLAKIIYAAPPLLSAKLQQGELDAVLTFWNFAARLTTAGCREIAGVADCLQSLGLPAEVPLIGFVFRQDWAEAGRSADALLNAVHDAEHVLATDATEWDYTRHVMDAPDEAVYAALRGRFLQGLDQAPVADDQRVMERLFAILLQTGGPQGTAGLKSLPDGLFWHGRRAA
jgi:NitT/TauT family transport system substrate-binding protein